MLVKTLRRRFSEEVHQTNIVLIDCRAFRDPASSALRNHWRVHPTTLSKILNHHKFPGLLLDLGERVIRFADKDPKTRILIGFICSEARHRSVACSYHTIAVVDEPYGRVMSWICLLDQFDISATITGVRWRYCAFENLLGLWSGHSLVSSQNTTLQVHTFLCAKSLKPRSSPRPLVRCGTWSLGHSWHTDQGIDHRCFRSHLEQRGWRR